MKRKASRELKAVVIEAYRDGHSTTDIAARYGYSTATICSWLRDAEVEMRTRGTQSAALRPMRDPDPEQLEPTTPPVAGVTLQVVEGEDGPRIVVTDADGHRWSFDQSAWRGALGRAACVLGLIEPMRQIMLGSGGGQ